ncbi:MAG: maleylacetate reductase [Gemmatimonadetes bacterium]|nr:maleylacetate reductase [Gemmatimonadota bacterium]
MPDLARAFAYDLRPVRVVFGEGAVHKLGEEIDVLSQGERVMIVSTPGRADQVALARGALGARFVGTFDGAAIHVPQAVVSRALDRVREWKPDIVVSVGGGSAVGVAKAVAMEVQLLHVAVPTTYSGSEMTDIWGITDGDRKQTGRDRRVAACLVVYDPLLTASMPAVVSAASGMNAIAHGVEALYSVSAHPAASLLAEESIRLLADSLPTVVGYPEDRDGRAAALRGAHFAGRALDMTAMALHHKLCHVLGGSFALPHALTHAVVLPHATAYNAPEAPEAMTAVARALGAQNVPAGLYQLNHRIGITQTLRDLGLGEADLDQAAALAVQSSYANPRPVTEVGVRALLDDAYHGRVPR